jgi:transposase InsO family protein
MFLPCQGTITGPQIAKLYYQHLYPWFGLPRRLITDRDPCFTSHFRKALAKELRISWNLSTAYHPQTDGLSEQKNQWVKQFLRLVTTNQADWPTMLALAMLMHNNTKTSTTGYTPNRLILGLEPPGIPDHGEGSDNPLAEECADQLRQRRILAQEALNKVANRHSPSQNVFAKGQRVWLEAKNLALPYGSVKLAPRHHGPFQITQVISPVAYKLRLPPQ